MAAGEGLRGAERDIAGRLFAGGLRALRGEGHGYADLNFGEKLKHFLNLLAEKMAAVFTLAGDRMEMTVEELEILKSPHEILLIYTAEGKLKNVIQGTRAGHVYRGEIIEGGIFCHNHPGRRGPSDTDLRFALDHPGVTVRVVMKTKEGRRVIYRIRGKGKVDEKTIRRITECYGNECRAQGDDAAARDKALELTLHEFGDYLSVETALL